VDVHRTPAYEYPETTEMTLPPSARKRRCGVARHPEANTDIAHANDEYRKLLTDDATFTSATIEDLLAAKALAPRTAAALRRRYLR
jgi:hypothetical protein